jgi:hypothetical protein
MQGKKLELYCPTCEEVIEEYSEVTFLQGFRVLIKGSCCGHALQAVLDILPLLPGEGREN